MYFRCRAMVRTLALIGMTSFFVSSCASNPNLKESSDYLSDMEIAQIAEKTQHNNIAIRNYQRAAKDSPQSDEPKKSLVRIYQQQGSTQQVLFWLQDILKNNPKSEFAYYHLGQLMQQQASYNSAITYYLYLKNSPQYQSAALNNIAVMLQLHKQNKLATQCFYKGIRIYPDDEKLRYNAALSLIASNNSHDAIHLAMRDALLKTGDLQIQGMLKNASKADVPMAAKSGHIAHFHSDLLRQVQSWCGE